VNDEDIARRLQQEEYRLHGHVSSTSAHAQSHSPQSARGSPAPARGGSPAIGTSQVELEGLTDEQVRGTICCGAARC
jgi:hypothetical protein